MTAEAKIKDALIALDVAIKETNGEGIVPRLRELDELARLHRAEIEPVLAHFLERRSYAKALALLDGGGPARGACAPKSGH